MALNWSFKEKAGTVTEIRDGNEVTFNFYEGNALMIVTHEYEQDGEQYYNMQWFFIGEDHAKNCLGLSKGHDNMFGENGIARLTIYRAHCRQWKKIIDLFTRAFPNIMIEVLAAEPDAERSAQ